MANAHFVLLVFAFVLFVISTFNKAAPYNIQLIGAGLACWVASTFLV